LDNPQTTLHHRTNIPTDNMPKDGGATFSQRDIEVLALAWQCFDSEPKVRHSDTLHPSAALRLDNRMPNIGPPSVPDASCTLYTSH
jgi:hypothetical protein